MSRAGVVGRGLQRAEQEIKPAARLEAADAILLDQLFCLAHAKMQVLHRGYL